MPGYEFRFVCVKDGKVWITGEHVREGPLTDPFIWVPTETGDTWQMHTIYGFDGYMGHTERIGWTENGELIDWIRETDSGGDLRGLYVHHSVDAGRTWKSLGLARKHKVAVKDEFKPIETLKDPLWRIVNHECGGFVLRHRETETAPWRTVSRFSILQCPT